MNEARRLGTCTDTLTRRKKVTLSSTANYIVSLDYAATTYEGMPRSITSSQHVPYFQSLSAGA